jgi:hypothetical protein
VCRERWPCPPGRTHLADLAVTTPVAGGVWLRWCLNSARTDLVDEHPGELWARILGWYERQIQRGDAYRANRGMWRRWVRPSRQP